MNTQTQNKDGNWVPAIPLPYYLRKLFGWKYRCDCGVVFKAEEEYRGHYALKHILNV